MEKYPQPGDVYQSRLFPGETCKVVSVLDAKVTFEWMNRYNHIDRQTAPVIQFIRDFDLQTAFPPNDPNEWP